MVPGAPNDKDKSLQNNEKLTAVRNLSATVVTTVVLLMEAVRWSNARKQAQSLLVCKCAAARHIVNAGLVKDDGAGGALVRGLDAPVDGSPATCAVPAQLATLYQRVTQDADGCVQII